MAPLLSSSPLYRPECWSSFTVTIRFFLMVTLKDALMDAFLPSLPEVSEDFMAWFVV